MNKYLEETKLLDYNNKSIQKLITERKWMDLDEFKRIKAIYNYI